MALIRRDDQVACVSCSHSYQVAPIQIGSWEVDSHQNHTYCAVRNT